MKIILLILFFIFNLNASESTQDRDILSIGAAAGSYGVGPYLREYMDKSYYQVTGFYSYSSDYGNSGSIGVCYGHYIYESSEEPTFFLPDNLIIKGGGHTFFTPDYYHYMVAIGLALEYRYPNYKGFTYELSVDYIGVNYEDDYSKGTYIGLNGSIQIGFNF